MPSSKKSKFNFYYKAGEQIFENAKNLRQPQTPSEALLWKSLRRKSLKYKFRRQHPIGRFIADFYCHEALLVIEVDGDIHEIEDVKEHDENRQFEIEKLGLKVIRFTNDEVLGELSVVLNKIEEVVMERVREQE